MANYKGEVMECLEASAKLKALVELELVDFLDIPKSQIRRLDRLPIGDIRFDSGSCRTIRSVPDLTFDSFTLKVAEVSEV
jgi:hypothetical protein